MCSYVLRAGDTVENKLCVVFVFVELTLWWKKADNEKESNEVIVQFQADIC